jgi:amino acid adenylation domain-containing protein
MNSCYSIWIAFDLVFEQQVELTPNANAVVYKDQSVTYAELNSRANGLAHYLIDLGVKPDDLVAICVDRSLGLIIGILAILKAGGAYVPLDPAHASVRLHDILSDASPSIVLADTLGCNVLAKAPLWSRNIVDPNIRFEASFTNPCIADLGVHHLAYVLYTSGSTGKPKGVMVEHRNVTRLFSSTDGWFKFNDQDTWCLFHSYGFDVSVWEMWGALRNGGKLLIVSQDTARSPQDLYRVICEEGVTVLNMTPSAFKLIIGEHTQVGLDDKLRYVILAGEALSPPILQPWFATHGEDKPSIVNMYGPTEITVYATYRRMVSEDCSHPVSPIGQRLPDLRTYVLDKCGHPVPIGAVGELYVGGAGVARGYLNKTDLTVERFIPDPFAEEHDARMYKTGDLVRYLPDGSLVYLGRNDDQVKIRGFRIELGEIEARLCDHPSVAEAVVVATGKESDRRLVAYVVTPGDQRLDNTDGGYSKY